MIPATKKEANKLVLKILCRLALKDYESREWQQEVRNAFVLCVELESKEDFDEHAEALMDILTIHYPNCIDPMLDIVIDSVSTGSHSNCREMFKNVLRQIKNRSGLLAWEISEYIEDEFKN